MQLQCAARQRCKIYVKSKKYFIFPTLLFTCNDKLVTQSSFICSKLTSYRNISVVLTLWYYFEQKIFLICKHKLKPSKIVSLSIEVTKFGFTFQPFEIISILAKLRYSYVSHYVMITDLFVPIFHGFIT